MCIKQAILSALAREVSYLPRQMTWALNFWWIVNLIGLDKAKEEKKIVVQFLCLWRPRLGWYIHTVYFGSKLQQLRLVSSFSAWDRPFSLTDWIDCTKLSNNIINQIQIKPNWFYYFLSQPCWDLKSHKREWGLSGALFIYISTWWDFQW